MSKNNSMGKIYTKWTVTQNLMIFPGGFAKKNKDFLRNPRPGTKNPKIHRIPGSLSDVREP